MRYLWFVLLLLTLCALQQTHAIFFKNTFNKLTKFLKFEDTKEEDLKPEAEAEHEKKELLFDLPKILKETKHKLFNDQFFDSKEKFDLFKPKLLKDLFNLEEKLEKKVEEDKEKIKEFFTDKKELKEDLACKEKPKYYGKETDYAEREYAPKHKGIPAYEYKPAEPPTSTKYYESKPSYYHAEAPAPSKYYEAEPSYYHAEAPAPAKYYAPEPSCYDAEAPAPAKYYKPEPSYYHAEAPAPAKYHEPEPSYYHAEAPAPSKYYEPEPSCSDAEPHTPPKYYEHEPKYYHAKPADSPMHYVRHKYYDLSPAYYEPSCEDGYLT